MDETEGTEKDLVETGDLVDSREKLLAGDGQGSSCCIQSVEDALVIGHLETAKRPASMFLLGTGGSFLATKKCGKTFWWPFLREKEMTTTLQRRLCWVQLGLKEGLTLLDFQPAQELRRSQWRFSPSTMDISGQSPSARVYYSLLVLKCKFIDVQIGWQEVLFIK